MRIPLCSGKTTSWQSALRKRVKSCVMHRRNGIYGIEQPYPWKEGFSMFFLDSFQQLVELGAQVVIFDQCPHGSESQKTTQVLYDGRGKGT